MKLSYSTRGWNALSWDNLVDLAVEMEFDGIELCDVQKSDALVGKGGPFDRYSARATARDLRSKNLQIPVPWPRGPR